MFGFNILLATPEAFINKKTVMTYLVKFGLVYFFVIGNAWQGFFMDSVMNVSSEFANITFNPITGEDYTETVTYDRDRRFYYTCDNSVAAPPHWEDQASRVTQWRALDDAYDLAIHDLNSFIHGFPTNKLDANILRTAYTQIMDASNRYTFVSNVTQNNVSNDYFDTTTTTISISNLHNMVRNDPSVRTFLKDYRDAETTFDDIMRDKYYYYLLCCIMHYDFTLRKHVVGQQRRGHW
jgi:hypothetical protein